MRSIFYGLVIGAAFAFPARMSAQHNSFEGIAREELNRATAAWSASGFQPNGDVHIALLNADEVDTLAVPFSSDSQYVILGRCDRDCGEIYLKVNDPAGQLVARDDTSHAHPTLAVSPNVKGTYGVRVVMVSCSTEPCYYAIRVLAKAGTLR